MAVPVKKDMKKSLALLKRKPEHVIALAPGQGTLVGIELYNDTEEAWKPDCMITFADEQPEGCVLPLEIFQMPVILMLAGNSGATIEMPITMGAHMLADNNLVHVMNMTLRGPDGDAFGELIPIKVKCVLPQEEE